MFDTIIPTDEIVDTNYFRKIFENKIVVIDIVSNGKLTRVYLTDVREAQIVDDPDFGIEARTLKLAADIPVFESCDAAKQVYKLFCDHC